MAARSVKCGACSAKLKLPDSIPDGKKLKCPKCGKQFVLRSSSSASGPAKTAPAKPQPAPAKPDPVDPLLDPLAGGLDPLGSADPFGQDPLAGLDGLDAGQPLAAAQPMAAQPVSSLSGARPAAKRRRGGQDDEMRLSDYVLAILAFPVGLILGILWATQRQGKAKMMITLSSSTAVILLSLGFITFWVWPREIPEAPDEQPERVTLILDIDDSDELVDVSNPDGMSARLDLDEQPEEVRRALQANVRVEGAAGSVGSGVVMQREGEWAFILTNRHVIDAVYSEQRGQSHTPDNDLKSRVTYHTNQSTRGTVVWGNSRIDLVLLRARCPDEIEAAAWYPFPQVRVGEEVFAVGNPVNLGWTFTKGVVSAVRQVEGVGSARDRLPLIQTDVSIAGGSSGGGLYNKGGDLIGINTAMVKPEIAKSIGFAIRTSLLDELEVAQLKAPQAAEAQLVQQDGTSSPAANEGEAESAAPSADAVAAREDTGQPEAQSPGAAGSEDAGENAETPAGSVAAKPPQATEPPIPDLDLESYPPMIQRALKANVRITTGVKMESGKVLTTLGSGVVMKKQGDWALIATNRHVVDPIYADDDEQMLDDEAIVAKVTFFNKQSSLARIAWGGNYEQDLVVIQARCPKEVEPVKWYPFARIRVADDVFAVGNPVDLGWTYTKGVVSGVRTFEGVTDFYIPPLIQTDAILAGGSSGGGLYTRRGQLIGINTSKIDPEIATGIGFAQSIVAFEEMRVTILAPTKDKKGKRRRK